MASKDWLKPDFFKSVALFLIFNISRSEIAQGNFWNHIPFKGEISDISDLEMKTSQNPKTSEVSVMENFCPDVYLKKISLRICVQDKKFYEFQITFNISRLCFFL